MHCPFRLQAPALVLLLLASSCGKKPDDTAPAPVPSAAPSPPVPDAPPSPFFVVLQASTPLSFSGVEGGVWIGDAARARFASATGPADLTSEPMPEGLPEGPGKIVRVSGKWPNRAWLAFEKQKDDGKPESAPLFWLVKGKFTQVATNWNPHLALWSKNRMLSMSTSSGKLKVKVMGGTAKPPPDLPAARLDDASCAGSLRIQQIAALGSGEVFAAGNCRPEASPASRYVVVRWGPEIPAPSPAESGSAAPAPPPPPSAAAPATTAPSRPAVIAVVPPSASAAPAAEPAGRAAPSTTTPLRPGPIVVLPSALPRPPVPSPGPASSAAPATRAAPAAETADTVEPAGSAAAPDAAADADQGIPGTVFVFPGVSTNLSHRALYARTATDVFAAAVATGGKNASISYVAHFDGTAWNQEPLPKTAHPIRALTGTKDGTLWMVTDHEIWKRHPSGAWEIINPPTRAFPDPNPTWEFFDIWATPEGDVWTHARHTGASGEHHVILRLKSPKEILRWQ
jgi:hypothetical protein